MTPEDYLKKIESAPDYQAVATAVRAFAVAVVMARALPIMNMITVVHGCGRIAEAIERYEFWRSLREIFVREIRLHGELNDAAVDTVIKNASKAVH